MERKVLHNNWIKIRDQISEWGDELTDEDLDRIDGNSDQPIMVFDEQYEYSRNPTFVQVKRRRASYRPEDEERKNRFNRTVRVSQYSYYDNDDWPEVNNGRGSSKSSMKAHPQNSADRYHK